MSITSDSEMFYKFFKINKNLINKEYQYLEKLFIGQLSQNSTCGDDAQENLSD